MPRKTNILAQLDWLTILLYLSMVLLGWINIYAAVYNEEFQSIFDTGQRYGKQLIWIVLALAIAFWIVVVDGKAYSFFAYIFYAVMLILLVGVLLFGREVAGSRSWFDFGSFRFQPAEFAKFATALAFAKYVSTREQSVATPRNLAVLLGIVLVPAALILLQNDTGSALVYGVFVLVLYREGLTGYVLVLAAGTALLFVLSLLASKPMLVVSLALIEFFSFLFLSGRLKEALVGLLVFGGLSGLALGAAEMLGLETADEDLLTVALVLANMVFVVLSYLKRVPRVYTAILVLLGASLFTYSVDYIFHEVLQEHQRTRINVLLGLDLDTQNTGYNVHQSKVAIGSGGWTGKGFLQGTQTKYDFVPEQSTDFIFCTVGEEWGFWGSTIVVMLFVALILRLLFLAERQRSSFSRVYGYCVVSILFFHMAINIGMTIGLAPVIGIPLPFFSYGGSSLWAFTIQLFIFIRLDASRAELL